MDKINYILEHFKDYNELFPILFVGLFAGLASYYADDSRKKIVKVVLTSLFLTLLVFTLLTMADLPYLAKVGISAGAGYFGIDKSLELIQKLLSLKNQNKSVIDSNTAQKQEDINRILKKGENENKS